MNFPKVFNRIVAMLMSGIMTASIGTCSAFAEESTAIQSTAFSSNYAAALQDALLLSKIASKVYLIHRRDEFRGNKILSEKVSNTENIELVLSSTPKEIVGEKQVEKIIVTKDNSDREIIVSGVFVAVGSVPNSDLLKELVKLDNGYVVASEDGVTSADGIFVAGDVRTKKLRQVVTAVSDGANAVMSAEDYLLKSNL